MLRFWVCDLTYFILNRVTYLTLETKFLLEQNTPHKSATELNISTIPLFPMDTLHCLFLIQSSQIKFKAKGIKASVFLQQPQPQAGIKALQRQIPEFQFLLWNYAVPATEGTKAV